MSAILVDLIHDHFNSFQNQYNFCHQEHQQRHFQSKQNKNDSILSRIQTSTTHSQSIKFQTEKLRQELIQNYITIQTSNLSLLDGDDDDVDDDLSNSETPIKSNFQKDISQTLINIIHSIMATIVSSKKLVTQSNFSKSDYYDSSLTLLEYTASFICTKGDGSLVKDVVFNSNMLKFSSISNYESIRCTVCTFVGWCSTYLLDSIMINPTLRLKARSKSKSKSVSRCHDKSLSFLTGIEGDEEQNRKWRMDCIEFIMTEFLAKRMIDKNQAVRKIAIHSSCLLLSSIIDCVASGEIDDAGEASDIDIEEDDDNANVLNKHSEENRVISLMNELVHSLTWNMIHDPSHTNRSYVLQSLPLEKLLKVITSKTTTAKKIPYQQIKNIKKILIERIVSRVRDDKVKVRVDALDVLRKIHVENDLTVEMRCEILRQGLSTRYPATLAAATKMLCCGWMKTMNFDPTAVLNLFDPSKNESIAENVARAIISTGGAVGSAYNNASSSSIDESNNSTAVQISSEMTLMDLSDPEIREFKNNVMDSYPVSLGSFCNKADSTPDDLILNPSKVIYLRVMCEMISKSKTVSEVKKSNLLSKFVPDVTVLTEVLEKHLSRLIDIHNRLQCYDDFEEDHELISNDEEKEDEECFICIHLLKLAKVIDLNEEGSRRHLSTIIHRILCSPSTHDDLIESCVHVLAASSDSEASFVQSISEVLSCTLELVDEATVNDEERQARYLRAMEILSVTLENISRRMSKNAILQNFSNIILTTISDYSLGPMIRELGVSCLGRFVILMDEETVIEKYKVLLINIAFMEDEKIEIRAQALLAICDLALLYERFMAPIALDDFSDDRKVSLSDILLDTIKKSTKSLFIVSAEVAAKLMFSGRLHDSNILAHLIIIYFDQSLCSGNVDEESADVNEVGSPTRLQQLLTIFFPSYCMKSSIGKETILTSVPIILAVLDEKLSMRVRNKKKVSAWPIGKMVDYIIDLVERGGNEQSQDNPNPMLTIALSISTYLLEEGHQLSTSYLRSLCKILSKAEIDVETGDKSTLKRLKINLDELSMCITDDSAHSSFKHLLMILDDVHMSDSDTDNEEDSNSSALQCSQNELDDTSVENCMNRSSNNSTRDENISTSSEMSSKQSHLSLITLEKGADTLRNIMKNSNNVTSLKIEDKENYLDNHAGVIKTASSRGGKNTRRSKKKELTCPTTVATQTKSMKISMSSHDDRKDDLSLIATKGKNIKKRNLRSTRQKKKIIIESSESESDNSTSSYSSES